VTVSDRGTWHESGGEHRGRGIPLMEEFMDEVKFRRGSDGTTVELRRRIGSRPR
jgi:anti-sigma regulatory factor (Ser/Thr protein kinase)